MIYFSPTCGFLHADVHAELPDDATPISASRHRQLVEAQDQGAVIVMGPKGPVASRPDRDVDRLRREALHRILREERRRIALIACGQAQLDDAARIALAAFQLAAHGATSIDAGPAIERRAAIDGIQTASASLRRAVSKMSAARLSRVDLADDSLWKGDR